MVQRGHRVDDLDGGLGCADASPPDDLDRPACVRKQGFGVGAAQVDDLDRAGLAATVSAATATDPGGVCPGQSPQRCAQQRLIALHGEQVVPATLLEKVRVRPLAVQRIRVTSAPTRSGRVSRATPNAASSSPATTGAWASTN